MEQKALDGWVSHQWLSCSRSLQSAEVSAALLRWWRNSTAMEYCTQDVRASQNRWLSHLFQAAWGGLVRARRAPRRRAEQRRRGVPTRPAVEAGAAVGVSLRVVLRMFLGLFDSMRGDFNGGFGGVSKCFTVIRAFQCYEPSRAYLWGFR